MKNNDDIRRLLRDADPAESRELPPPDRARMRAVLTSSALKGRPRRSQVSLLAVGAALAMAVIACVALIPLGERSTVVTEAPPQLEAPTRIERPRPTRIVFTAPEGTKIFWFVSSHTPRS